MPLFVLFNAGAGHEIGVHQTHFVTGIQAEILLRRLFHEVFLLDPQLAGERDFAGAQFFVLKVIRSLEHLSLTLGIIIDHELHGMQHGHNTRSL